jgi:hypothetical protein
MLKNCQKFSFTLALGTILWNILVSGTIAQEDRAEKTKPEEASIAEDDISTRKGISWGGGNFPYSQVLTIQDSLVSSPVGRVILDKHGIDDSGATASSSFNTGNSLVGSLIGSLVPIEAPFSAPAPGKSVFITLWGSKIEGCFVEAIIQVAPEKTIAAKSIVPTMLELGIDDRIIQLTPQGNKPKVGSIEYTYKEKKSERESKWYMARQIFPIDAATAKIFANAPAEETKARFDFEDEDSIVIPIGKGTVEGWKQAYSFNPACSSSSTKSVKKR